MKNISEKAGCSQKYTNHSLRATTCTILDEAGFQNRHIMSVTGRSESSLKHYSRTSDKKKRLMSATLASKMNENVTIESNDGVLDIPEVERRPILTKSQEKMILSESNYNNNNEMSTSSVQHFYFHGPVTFFDK